MNNLDFVFTPTQYEQLQKEYARQLTPDTGFCLSTLNSLIKALGTYNFQMPLCLQNSVLNNLINAKQILNILHQNDNYVTLQHQSNPFELIHQLTQISSHLNSHSLKSVYQILYLKSNNLIINSIKQISNYFANKNLKIYKFI